MSMKNLAQRVLPLIIAAVMMFAATACGKNGNPQTPAPTPTDTQIETTTERWIGDTDATYSGELSEDEAAVNFPEQIIQVGKTADGKDIFAFEHFNIAPTFLADEISEARLFIKLTNGSTPKQLKIATINAAWDSFFDSRKTVESMINAGTGIVADVAVTADGWVSLPVTDIVKTWLSGGLQNNGLAIYGVTAGETYSFASIYGDEKDMPYIAVTGAVGERPLTYGRFGYTKTPLPNAEDMGGNCMSYALRDTNMIMGDDMAFDIPVIEAAYKSGGVDAIADYVAERVITYVEAHEDGLVISKFRQIDSYDSEIDPKTEYRIAMRVGTDKYSDDPDFNGDRAFDYHFWLQLNDGRWAQKFPTGDSLITPCTAGNIDPGKYPWSAGYNWTGKSRDYYTSKTIYFAVTKDTDEITRHRGEVRDRNYGEEDGEDDNDTWNAVPTEAEAKAIIAELIPKAAVFYGQVYNGDNYFRHDESATIPGTADKQGGNPYALVVDDDINTLDDLRAATEKVFMPELAEKLFYRRYLNDVDKPVDELDYATYNVPLYYEYEGQLYVNTNNGGKGFAFNWLFDTTDITELTADQITATVERTLFDEPDGVSTVVLGKWGGEWVIANDFIYGEGQE
ncbi:hypothetical protein FACS189490_08880 [Clostridia bacterium]|nr:hypothetical protein FACS189490_08880 [Clostridia bacterium]